MCTRNSRLATLGIILGPSWQSGSETHRCTCGAQFLEESEMLLEHIHIELDNNFARTITPVLKQQVFLFEFFSCIFVFM